MANQSFQDWVFNKQKQDPLGFQSLSNSQGGILGSYQMDQQFGQMPSIPDFHGITNPDGTMQSQYQVNPGADITADQSGLNAFRNRALSQGPSAWASMQTNKQMGDAAQQSASGMASARSSLASHGGLDSGASERIATQGQKDLLNNQQNAAGNVAIQDEQMKQNALSQLPGMEIAATEPAFRNKAMDLNAQQFNAGNAISQNNALNLDNMQKYQNKMQGWASNQQANAIANSGKK